MTSWILEVEGALNPEQRAVAEGLAAILERLNPPHLDTAGSSAVADTNGLHVTLVHRSSPELRVDVLTGRVDVLTGRIELHVWKRPLGVKTRSYWINDDGQPELFLRGGTAGPYLGWSRTPEIYRFDYTRPGPFP